jgi:excreted virulence factor EspC (type VII ESX diderm)
MTGFQVDLAQLRDHAQTVGDHASQLSAVAGGLSDGPQDNSLGVFVQFLTAGLQGAMTAATGSIRHASAGVSQVSASLRHTASGYQQIDEHNATRLRGIDPSGKDQ